MKKYALLLGTSRYSGNTSSLINVVAKEIEITQFHLKDYQISAFDYEHKNIDDDFISLVLELLDYEHIIFASPVYWYSMSAEMKVFFDRLSDLLHVKKELGRKLRTKSCSIISTGASALPERSFEEVFINSFKYLGMDYMGMLYSFCDGDFTVKGNEENIKTYIGALQS
ncbi:MAG: flavodoxin family protein [Alcanivoracaceae bacterium]|nr:flavodoxin family protein [Alcanivoracaceae bacterium]